MSSRSLKIAFWGSSLVSAYWNGAATYYRGILRALAGLGYSVYFFEPDVYDRQKHRDIPDPDWADVIVYDPDNSSALRQHLIFSAQCDIVVKASGVGILDTHLEQTIGALSDSSLKVFWDVDAPATLERMIQNATDPFRDSLRSYNLVLTYGGGERVTSDYRNLGAKTCIAIYNAFDPDTHFPVSLDERFAGDCAFLGNRLPDRESRVDEYFFRAASTASKCRFVLGGNGWSDKTMPPNVFYAGHIYTADHNRLNCSSKTVLNINRDSMARYGFSPATRVFEAAGAAACIITDPWEGIDFFLEPKKEILIAQNGDEVADIVQTVTHEQAKEIGQAARSRVLADHTYQQRAKLVDETFHQLIAEKRGTYSGVGQ